jgi:PAS domain S-box-containing protein
MARWDGILPRLPVKPGPDWHTSSVIVRYSLAALATLVALLLRFAIDPYMGDLNPFTTLYPAIAFTAFYCGIGPSVVCAVLGWLGVDYWFVPPRGSFAVKPVYIFMSLAYVIVAGLLVALGESSRRRFGKLQESEKALQASEWRARQLIESNIIPVICANMQGITEANDAFLNMVGYTRDELAAGKIDWVKMTPPEYVLKDRQALEQLKTLGYCTPFEKEYIHKNGRRVPLLIGATLLNPSPLEAMCFIVDLSELKRAEAELRKAHDELDQKVKERTQELAETIASLQSEMQVRQKTEQQLRELSARLLRLQDEERSRIARDLHDSTGQTLTALKLTLASLENLVANVPEAPHLLQDLEALADQAIQEIRTTSHLLHPPLLDEAGFSPAAQWYVEGFGKRSGVQTRLEVSGLSLTKEAELVFFRVLQESLTNVLRHSGSTAVDIRLYSEGEDAALSIRDYGKGIASEKLKTFHQTAAGVGVGLGGMKQRVRELGGHLRVECDGTGTCVTATLPLAKTEPHHKNGGNDQAA